MIGRLQIVADEDIYVDFQSMLYTFLWSVYMYSNCVICSILYITIARLIKINGNDTLSSLMLSIWRRLLEAKLQQQQQ